MAPRATLPALQQGHLAENVMHFARVLRAAGLPIGPDRVIDAVRALEVAGVERRDDFYWTLASVFLDRREQPNDPDVLEPAPQLGLEPGGPEPALAH